MCMTVLATCAYVHYKLAKCPWNSEEDIEPPCGLLGIDPRSFAKTSALSAVRSLQTPLATFLH